MRFRPLTQPSRRYFLLNKWTRLLMLFDKSPFESYKERNLYYKFFAGYFFNELVPGAGNGLKRSVD